MEKLETNFMYFNSNATVDEAKEGAMYGVNNLMGMNSVGGGFATLYFHSAGQTVHGDAPDDVKLTVDDSGNGHSDLLNRIKAMDAMASIANTRNKEGFVVAYSEIENVKPGGITGIAITLDT